MKLLLNLIVISAFLFCNLANAQETKLKPLLFGIVAMGNTEFHQQDGGIPDNSLAIIVAHPGVFDGVDINIAWSQLQPEQGPIHTEVLDEALASVRAYNAENPNRPLAVKLRVWGGPNAPSWIKNLGGPPVAILHINQVSKVQYPLTVGRFWSQEYQQAWRDLQHQLAKKYDADPLVREVSNSSCSTMTSEPFIFPGDAESLNNMRMAGYNDSAMYACLMKSADDYEGWRTTRVEYPFSPFRRTDSGRTIMDQEVTFNIMKLWRQRLGPRGILSNYGLTDPEPPQLIPVWNHMKELGPPFELQIGNLKQADWNATMQDGISVGVSSIEIWTLIRPETMLATVTQNQFAQWTEALKSNLRHLAH